MKILNFIAVIALSAITSLSACMVPAAKTAPSRHESTSKKAHRTDGPPNGRQPRTETDMASTNGSTAPASVGSQTAEKTQNPAETPSSDSSQKKSDTPAASPEVTTGSVMALTVMDPPMRTMAAHVAVSSDCRWVAAGGRYRETMVWRTSNGHRVWMIPEKLNRQYIDLLARSRLRETVIPYFIPDSSTIFAALDGDTIRIIDIGGNIGAFRGGFLGPILDFAVMPSGKRLVAVYPDRVAVWRTPAGLVYNIQKSGIVRLFPRPGAALLVSGDGSLHELSMSDGKLASAGMLPGEAGSPEKVSALWDGENWHFTLQGSNAVFKADGSAEIHIPKSVTVLGFAGSAHRILVFSNGNAGILVHSGDSFTFHPLQMKGAPITSVSSFQANSRCLAISVGKRVAVVHFE